MSNKKKLKQLRVEPSNVIAQINTFSEGLGYAAALPKAQVDNLRKRGSLMPVDVIELLAEIAQESNGVVAGMAFDAAAARDALARVKNAKAVAKAARRLSRRAVSDAVQNLALVADRSMAVTQAMDRVVRTPEGKPFVETNDQIRSLMRSQSRPTRKAAAKAAVTEPANTTPKGAVVVNAPGTAPSTQPS